MKNIFAFCVLLGVAVCQADTPPPNTVKAKVFDGSGTQSIGNVSDALKVNFTNSSLPLATGAATSANQSTEITALQSLDSKTVIVDTDNVTVGASALPTGAATSALQTTANTSLSSIDSKLTAPLVVNQSSVPASNGRASIALARNVYSSVNVTTSAYVQLVSSTSDVINYLDIFDSSGQTLVLAVGATGFEVDQFYIIPGGNGGVPLKISAGSRISIKAVSATANTGEIDLTGYK